MFSGGMSRQPETFILNEYAMSTIKLHHKVEIHCRKSCEASVNVENNWFWFQCEKPVGNLRKLP